MRILRRIALVSALVVAFILWLWGAAVRAVPDVRRRKAAARARRRGQAA